MLRMGLRGAGGAAGRLIFMAESINLLRGMLRTIKRAGREAAAKANLLQRDICMVLGGLHPLVPAPTSLAVVLAALAAIY